MVKNKEESLETGVPICEKCGNIMTKDDMVKADENFDSPVKKELEWFCPHCQGEINFLGEDDE